MKPDWKRFVNLLLLAAIAFGGLGLEVVVGVWIEPALYHAQIGEWTITQNIIHWCITCFLWGLVALYVVKDLKKSFGIDLFIKTPKMSNLQKIIMVVFVIASLILSYLDWHGFKVVKEYNYNGLTKFIFQYIYYCFEVVLVLLIIVIGQYAFECIFKNKNIPYGGIVVALTWGVAHFFTKDISTGLMTMFTGFSYGATYLLVNRNIKKAYLFLLPMFIL